MHTSVRTQGPLDSTVNPYLFMALYPSGPGGIIATNLTRAAMSTKLQTTSSYYSYNCTLSDIAFLMYSYRDDIKL